MGPTRQIPPHTPQVHPTVPFHRCITVPFHRCITQRVGGPFPGRPLPLLPPPLLLLQLRGRECGISRRLVGNLDAHFSLHTSLSLHTSFLLHTSFSLHASFSLKHLLLTAHLLLTPHFLLTAAPPPHCTPTSHCTPTPHCRFGSFTPTLRAGDKDDCKPRADVKSRLGG